MRPFQAFLANKASGGILLLLCTVLALAWANSPLGDWYASLWATYVTVGVGTAEISKPALLWINDGLMAVFFFLVGLEIKREILVGELASPRQAALPIAGAVGGIVAPAAIYAMLNAGGEGAAGWAIPMATDIAFALGVLALLGSRVPLALTIFLTALAIVDDIAAVLVIAFFYTEQINGVALLAGAACLVVLAVMNWAGARHPLTYGLIGIVLWVAVLQSGIHATIAGVTLAMFIPSRTRIHADRFLARSHEALALFERSTAPAVTVLSSDDQQAALHALENAAEDVQPPLHRMEHSLHPWVTFFIMPVFALANAGVVMGGETSPSLFHPVALGVMLGLLIGKPAGILLTAWLAVRLGFADLPASISWTQIHGAAWLGGIGFTMALFVGGLAFGDSPLLAMAKLGILSASAIAAVIGSTLLIRAAPAVKVTDGQQLPVQS